MREENRRLRADNELLGKEVRKWQDKFEVVSADNEKLRDWRRWALHTFREIKDETLTPGITAKSLAERMLAEAEAEEK